MNLTRSQVTTRRGRWRGGPRARLLAAFLMVGIVAAFGLFAVGCGDDEPDTIQAALVAPPNVPPKQNRANAHVVVDLVAKEEIREISPGVEYEVWSFNDYVPGPMIRVQVGDTVEIRLQNASDSKVTHNIDLHSVNGPGGGAESTNVAPGETKAFSFKALAPGLFTYHCAQGIVADHISNGMYGGILVEEPRGKARYDREYYIGQHEYYLTDTNGPNGVPALDVDKMLAEDATYVVWNGATDGLTGDNALTATTGETVRLYVTNGGPNFTSSYHVIGEIFDRAYAWGSLANLPLKWIQTISVPPGGAAITDMKIDVPGDYKIVDHALGRLTKGAVGIITATGDNDFDVFRDLQEHPLGSDVEEPTATAEPAATSEPDDGGNGEPATTEDIAVEMDDNVFIPDTFTVKAGSVVNFQLDNIGNLPHNMRIADLAGSYDGDTVSDPELLSGGQTGVLTWEVPDATGTYKFRCDVHPVEMVGTITVE